MRFVKILGDPLEAVGLSKQRPVTGFVSGAAKQLAVHEAFNGENRMAVSLLPILRKTVTHQREGAAGKIGPMTSVGQNDKTAVLSQQMEAGPAL